MNIPEHLIEKYNVPVPRYTSYPPANFFSIDYTGKDYREAVILSNEDEPQNISIYLHIPFCAQLCHYCGCNTHITRNEQIKAEYLEALKSEILMLKPLLNQSRRVSQVHWGGGTPNSLRIDQIEDIMELIYKHFQFIDQPEIAIECNPAHLDHGYTERLIAAGFNRISLGIQDFSEKVLNGVNREIPAITAADFVRQIQASGKAKVNLDFIYGLPHQTISSFSETMEKAIQLQPDRLVTFSYAHVPNIKKSQKILEKAGLVPPAEKLRMFENTYELMKSAGYVPIGLDHFAKADDELAVALKNRSLHRNFQGYCTRETTGQVYAFGTTGISQLENGYAQNAKTVSRYIELINKGEFTTEKGYAVTAGQKIIRHVINEMMCNQYISWPAAAEKMNISEEQLKQVISYDESVLEAFKSDNLLNFDRDQVIVTELGRFFIRNIAASFDAGLNKTGKTFSKAL
ncbi:MAG: oxygen-independent coproporphyrinogen III oxidase [Bacteroidota bacterium]